MDLLFEDKKNELIAWVSHTDNEVKVDELLSIVKEKKFDFKKEMENGLTPEESKERLKNRIREWWGK
jgi:hypothetical protein